MKKLWVNCNKAVNASLTKDHFLRYERLLVSICTPYFVSSLHLTKRTSALCLQHNIQFTFKDRIGDHSGMILTIGITVSEYLPVNSIDSTNNFTIGVFH